MATAKSQSITREEFDQRLDTSNERLRQKLVAAQERVQGLEALVARKEAFAQRLAQLLTEVEREESEIALLEKGLRVPFTAARRRSRPTPTP